MKQLKELCSGFIVPQRDKPKEFGGTIPWCRIEDIEGKYLNGTKSDQYVSEETIKKMNLKIVPKGAVICACRASLGVQAMDDEVLQKINRPHNVLKVLESYAALTIAGFTNISYDLIFKLF